jgi:hypothetical protein
VRFGQLWFWLVVSVSFGKVRGWFCRFSKSAGFLFAKFLVSLSAAIVSVSVSKIRFSFSQVWHRLLKILSVS